jgi:hypothetical protein
VFWSAQELDGPQSLNPYSYAGDNPIVNKDPSGKVYGGFNFGGTFSSPYIVGFSWNVGFNIDAHGIDFIAGIGPGVGYKFDRLLYFSSGKLSHRLERQVVTSGGFAGIAGYDYASTLSWPLGGSAANAEVSSEHILVAGFGAGAGVTNGISIPLIQWSPEPQDIWTPLSPLTFMPYSAIPADTHSACGLLCTPVTSNTAQAKQNNSSTAAPSTSSGGTGGSSSSGSGYGSPGTVYTNFGPANGHSACGTLCL